MSKRLLFGALGVVLATGLVVSQSNAENSLVGFSTPPSGNGGPAAAGSEILFLGDLTAEFGIGCSNPAGTSGGPNDIAQGVIALTPTPFSITSHFYNIFTQVSPNITSLSFVAWNGGASPGPEIGRQTGLPFALGSHTVAIAPAIPVTAAQAPAGIFFFGHNQAQTNVGMRWGVDSSTPSQGASYIRAPSCGLSVFGTLDSIGFPGNWVMSATINDDPVPVELTSWGSIKADFR